MKKLIQKIQQWYAGLLDERAAERERVLTERFNTESNEAIQVKEYGGQLFLSYRETPLLPLDFLDTDQFGLFNILEESRESWARFQTKLRMR